MTVFKTQVAWCLSLDFLIVIKLLNSTDKLVLFKTFSLCGLTEAVWLLQNF